MRRAIPKTADRLAKPDEYDDTVLNPLESEDQNDQVWTTLKAKVDCEPPNGELERFSGKIFVDDDDVCLL